jgi:hypothetical protein
MDAGKVVKTTSRKGQKPRGPDPQQVPFAPMLVLHIFWMGRRIQALQNWQLQAPSQRRRQETCRTASTSSGAPARQNRGTLCVR